MATLPQGCSGVTSQCTLTRGRGALPQLWGLPHLEETDMGVLLTRQCHPQTPSCSVNQGPVWQHPQSRGLQPLVLGAARR